ncbi:MAG TPA: TonB-dependent receptor [Gemmatimonadaceae bacterium]|nr:TonB-dependent receptor [Gemmatimonadaceae bacterium]
MSAAISPVDTTQIHSMLIRRSFVLLLLAAVPAFPAPAHAQRADSSIVAGAVHTPRGAPVPSARVRIDSAHAVRADSAGAFSLRVPSGEPFALHVERAGFAEFTIAIPALQPGDVHRVDVVLTRMTQLGVFAVRASVEPPLVNHTDAATGGTLTARDLEALPSDGRDPLKLAFYVPGVTQATGFFDTAPVLSINGSNSLYTQYFIDGLDNNEGFLGGTRVDLPLSALRRVDVKTNTYGVEFGRSSNGIVNYVTRSGTNDWHGDLFAYGRPGRGFDARPTFTPSNTDPQRFHRYQLGGSGGGALDRDRTFVFGAAEYLDEKTPQAVTTAFGNGAGAQERRQLKLFGRLDEVWSGTQTTTFKVAASNLQLRGEGGGLVVPEADVGQYRLGIIGSVTHRSDVTAHTSNMVSVQVATYHWYYPPTASSLNTPQVYIESPQGALQAIVGSSGFQFDERETQVSLRDELVRQAGTHTLKAGTDVIAAGFRLDGAGTNPHGLYEVANTGNITRSGGFISIRDIPANVQVKSYTVDAILQHVDQSQAVYGLYVEDAWRATPLLNVTYGLRWDYDDITSRGASSPDLTNFQPRASFNWTFAPDRVFRGGAGVYIGKFPYTVYSDATQFGSNGSAAVTFDGAGAPAFGQAPSEQQLLAARGQLPPREIRQTFARGLKNPRSYQATLGYSQQFGPSWGVSFDVVYAATEHLPRLWDLNAVNYTLTAGDTINRPPSFGDAHRPVTPRPGSFRQLTTTDAGGRSEYAGLYTEVQHRFSDTWTADLNWIWSHARNNTEDVNFAATQGNNFKNEWADAVNDRRHVVRLRSVYTPVPRVQLSGIADFQTGQPINWVAGKYDPATGTATYYDLNGSTPGFGDVYLGNLDRFPGLGRNSGRLPSVFNLDLGAGYIVPMGRSRGLELRLDVFNALNSVQESGFANGIAGGGPRVQVGRPGDPIVYTTAAQPRRVQLSARYTF